MATRDLAITSSLMTPRNNFLKHNIPSHYILTIILILSYQIPLINMIIILCTVKICNILVQFLMLNLYKKKKY